MCAGQHAAEGTGRRSAWGLLVSGRASRQRQGGFGAAVGCRTRGAAAVPGQLPDGRVQPLLGRRLGATRSGLFCPKDSSSVNNTWWSVLSARSESSARASVESMMRALDDGHRTCRSSTASGQFTRTTLLSSLRNATLNYF
jgi:hypothetical protein